MLMDKAKGDSALFLLVSQPIQVRATYSTWVLVEFHSSLVLDYLCLDYVEILSVRSRFWVYTFTEREQGLLLLGHSQIPWAQSSLRSTLQKKRESYCKPAELIA